MLLASQQCVTQHSLHDLHPVPGLPTDLLPTTGDVQLYPDPATCATKVPILYADCEGLIGGDGLPRALEHTRRPRGGDGIKSILWAESAEGGLRGRPQIIAHIFPKLLYTFCDVVVFVMKEIRYVMPSYKCQRSWESLLTGYTRTMESIAADLLVPWAERAMEKSLNQAAKPHIIVVVNTVDIDFEESGWDTDVVTSQHLERLDELSISNNRALKKIARTIAARGGPHHDSIGGLLRYHYTSVTVVRLPRAPYFGRMKKQVGQLYRAIETAAAESYREKSRLGVAVPADGIQRLFSAAVHQFSDNLDEPFDLLAEAWRGIRELKGMVGGLLHFICTFRRASKRGPDATNAVKLLTALAPVFSSCLLLDAERHNLLGMSPPTRPSPRTQVANTSFGVVT